MLNGSWIHKQTRAWSSCAQRFLMISFGDMFPFREIRSTLHIICYRVKYDTIISGIAFVTTSARTRHTVEMQHNYAIQFDTIQS
jgi:hypothetical protein